MTYQDAMRLATKQLSLDEVKSIMMAVSGQSSVALLVSLNNAIPKSIETAFWACVQQCKNGYPLPYVWGEVSFDNRLFLVREGVLIPRPDTECLLGHTRTILDGYPPRSVVVFECGYGAGVLGICLSTHSAVRHVLAWDCNPIAYQLACENAQRLRCGRVHFFCSDFFAAMTSFLPAYEDQTVIVVSNPPYIDYQSDVDLATSVKQYEPREALDGGQAGLRFYKRFLDVIPIRIPLVVEIGFSQKRWIDRLCRQASRSVQFYQDLSQHWRVASIV